MPLQINLALSAFNEKVKMKKKHLNQVTPLILKEAARTFM